MSKSQEPVRSDLTDAQKTELSTKTGKDADAVELSGEELEERIAPMMVK